MPRPLFYRTAPLGPGRRLHSFGDPIGEVPVLGEPLRLLQERLVRSCGGDLRDIRSEREIPSGENAFWFEEDLYFSEGFLRAAIRAAEGKQRALRFCLRQNSLNERYALPDREGFPEEEGVLRPRFGFVPSRGQEAPTIEDALIEQKIFKSSVPIPRSFLSAGEFSYDQSTVVVGRVFTPFHLLQLNLAALICSKAAIREKVPAWLQDRLFGTHSRLFYFLLRRQNRIGKRCRIHPSAILEGATIGDDVTIGANAVVRLSQIGSGTLIEDSAVVKFSVLGKNNYICNSNQLVSCMSYDDVFLIHGPYQFTIFGRGVVAMAVLNCDVRLDQKSIRISSPNGLLNSRQPLLGIAYGHGAKVGAGNSIAPGRIVPNGHQMTPPGIVLDFGKFSAPPAELRLE